jgi:hypothetical protein
MRGLCAIIWTQAPQWCEQRSLEEGIRLTVFYMLLHARSADQSRNDARIVAQSLTEAVIQYIMRFEREETGSALPPRHISRLAHTLEVLYVAIPCDIEQVPATM